MAAKYDVIVIGGGPNGLTCSAYLAKARLRVLLLERKHELGGGLYTEDYGTPFRFNVHATYMMLGELMPPHRDLELDELGLRYIYPEVQAAFVHDTGTALVFYRDAERSVQSVGQLSKPDAGAFRQMYEEFRVMTDDLIIPATYEPPMSIGEQMELLNETDLGRRVAEISEMTPREIIESYGFADPRVSGALLYLATMWGIHPDVGGVGFMVPLYITRMLNAALVKGGSHVLASAIYQRVIENGGEIKEWSDVEAITMTSGTAKGVILADGTEFEADAVVSTLPPDQTFLRFVGREYLPSDLLAAVEGWEWDEWSLFTSHIGIKGEPPHYSAAEFNPDVNAALITYLGVESPEDVLRHVEEIESGTLPTPLGGATCISYHDSLQATKGPFGPLHTLRWEGSAPFDLAGQAWDDVKQEYGQRCFENWKRYAPNLNNAKVIRHFDFSPLDIQRRLVNMWRGSIKHGAYTSMQMGAFRPHEDCSSYRTPIPGLYVGGASTYPGGMITLGPGYNAAKVVAEDLGREVWWSPPDYVLRAREQGYLPSE